MGPRRTTWRQSTAPVPRIRGAGLQAEAATVQSVRTRDIDVDGGAAAPVRLRVDEAGHDRSQAVPLLAIHGFTGARTDFSRWHPWLDLAADLGFHAVAPDLRGHGDSAKPDDPAAYSLEIFARDVLGLADTLGWPRFVLWGHSVGGMVAQVATLADPSRVSSLVLQATGHGPVSIDPAMVDMAVTIVEHEGIDALAKAMAEIDDPLSSVSFKEMVAREPEYQVFCDNKLRAVSPVMYSTIAREVTRTPDRLAALLTLDVPTKVIVGEQDRTFLEPSARIGFGMRAAGLSVLAHGGHSPQNEIPARFEAALVPFLKEAAQRWHA